MDFRISANNIPYSNVMQSKQTKGVERQSFQGSMEKVMQKQKVKPTQDSIEFSEDSDYKKLGKIKELNDSTDFSGMTDIEKYSIIQERYEKAFPDLNARMTIGAGIKVNADMQKQYLDDIKKAGTRQNLYYASKGYDKMTDEQKWESIQKEYGNPKNGIEQVCALVEMSNAGLIDWDAYTTMTRHIEYKAMVTGVIEHGQDYHIYDTEVSYQYGYEYLQNNKVNFEDIKNGVMDSITISADYGDINEQIQKKQQLGYEMDYITELMTALEERKD